MAPPTGNGSQNLVFAEIDDEVDTTDVYTDDESDEETNAVELSDIIEDMDEQDYHTDSESEEDMTPLDTSHPHLPDRGGMRELTG